MSMEIMLRYIVGIAIAYGIGKWIYQSIRSRSIDYFLLAIIALMGAVLWLSRGFLISNRVYDFLMIVSLTSYCSGSSFTFGYWLRL